MTRAPASAPRAMLEAPRRPLWRAPRTHLAKGLQGGRGIPLFPATRCESFFQFLASSANVTLAGANVFVDACLCGCRDQRGQPCTECLAQYPGEFCTCGSAMGLPQFRPLWRTWKQTRELSGKWRCFAQCVHPCSRRREQTSTFTFPSLVSTTVCLNAHTCLFCQRFEV